MTPDSLSRKNAGAAPSWREIEAFLEEIASLAESEIASPQFHAELLDRAVRALGALGGAVWTRTSQGLLHLEHQINFRETRLPESREDQLRHAYLLDEAMRGGAAKTIAPQSGPAEREAGANPSPLWLVLTPVMVEGEAAALLEIFHGPATAADELRESGRLLGEVAGLAADHYRRVQFCRLRDEQTAWRRMERFLRETTGRMELADTATATANEARVALDCDRVSVAVVRHGRCRMQSISGVDWFDRRANEVRRLERLAEAALASGAAIWSSGSEEDVSLAPQIEEMLQAHLDDSACRTFGAFPLRVGESSNADDPIHHDDPPLGVLIVEHFSSRLDEEARHRAELLAPHAAAALAPALELDRIPLAGLWRRMGSVAWLRTLPKWAVAAAVAALVIAALATIPADFAVEASGQLQPQLRRHVFAPSDGVVVELLAKHDRRVRRDEPLAVLRDPKLDFEFRRIEGEIQTAQKRLSAIESLRLEDSAGRDGAEDRPRRWTAEKEEVEEALGGLRAQRDVLRQRQASLTIRSPLDGVVITWDVERRLESRPVSRGQVLMTVADLQGPWVVELEVPDRRMGHVAEARRASENPLEVSFVCEADPAVVHRGRIVEVSLTADARADDQAQSRIVALADGKTLLAPRPGTVVKAKIHCGRRSVGYVWLHGLWEAAQRGLWF
ncbi:MAG: efflux RND transporter periplasmic adaptor subunit [Planctomycetes bacterium]|nr:efflux RND transporter periplasmic adaptor subunit [Planctomycetota bacterium]